MNPCIHSKSNQENTSGFPQCLKMAEVPVPKLSCSLLSATHRLSVSQAVAFPKWRCGTATGRWLERVVWKGSTRGLGLRGSTQTVAAFWHVGPHSYLLCSPKERQTVLKPLRLLPPAVLEMGAHGSCCLPAACGLLLHPTLSSSRLSGYECGLPGRKRVCVYAIIHLFVCIHEKTTQKPVLAHVAHAGFREKLCAFICLCFLLCKQSCNGEAELSMEQFAWRPLVWDKKEQSSKENFLCKCFLLELIKCLLKCC